VSVNCYIVVLVIAVHLRKVPEKRTGRPMIVGGRAELHLRLSLQLAYSYGTLRRHSCRPAIAVADPAIADSLLLHDRTLYVGLLAIRPATTAPEGRDIVL